MIIDGGFEITNSITTEEYLELRQSVEWSKLPAEEAEMSLTHSAFLCCIRKDGKAVGFGRLIWDHGYMVLVSDIIVRPEYQGQGLGRVIMETLMEQVQGFLKPGYRIMVNLMANKGKEGFYRKFGFIERPNEEVGCGMHQWLDG